MNKSGLKYNVSPILRVYNGSSVISEESFGDVYPSKETDFEFELTQSNAQWKCKCSQTPLAGSDRGMELLLTFRLEKGTTESTGVGVAVDIQPWSIDNYVIIPAAVYDGNRFDCLEKSYPPLFEPHEHRIDMPVTVTDVARLGKDDGPYVIEQTTGDASTPAIGFHDQKHAVGCWLLTQQENRLGNLGLFVEESPSRDTARLLVLSPPVRTYRHGLCETVKIDETPPPFNTGDELHIRINLYFFPAKSKTDFLSLFPLIRENIENNCSLVPQLPFSEAWNILEEKHNRENWNEKYSFYNVGTSGAVNELWQLGWVGGCMSTYPLLASGSEISRQRAVKNLDTVLTGTQAASGFFYGMGDGETFFSDGFSGPHPCNMHLVRKNGDALYFFIKHFLVMDHLKLSESIKPQWKTAVTKLADAFVNLWKKFGQLGQFINIETGEILVGGSTCGAIVPAGLVMAEQYFNEPAYLAAAQDIAEDYLNQFRQSGITTGGPGEILQAPDSESAFALLESMIVLYERTNDRKWLTAAQQVAHLCMTWCVSYDYRFPKGSLFDRLNIRSAGAVFANVQNKHGAPAVCTLSGDSLLRLYRYTGDEIYIRQLIHIAHNLTQYLSRKDRPVGVLKPGWMNERVNLSDWEGKEMVGQVHNQSCWPEVSCMLTWQEVPGLYVRPDLGKAFCFDNINMKLEQDSANGLTIELHNPTEFPAKVRVLVEDSSAAAKPLETMALLKCPVIELQPGETKKCRQE